MIPPGVYQGLVAVRGLARGRSGARETEPATPVAETVVKETLPFMNRHIRGMVEAQLLTGMRPGEVCVMRSCDIDTSGKVWLYRPNRHKTAHHGHQRVIAIRPKAQEIIQQFLTLDTQSFLFSPRRAMEEILLGEESVSPCPICQGEGTRLDIFDRVGHCYGGCSNVTGDRLLDCILIPPSVTLNRRYFR